MAPGSARLADSKQRIIWQIHSFRSRGLDGIENAICGYMTFRQLGRPLVGLLSFASLFCVLAIPAAADEYQVTVTLLGDTSIPAPLSYTFDTTTPFQASGSVAYTNLSATFDSQCGSDCSLGSVDYNANVSQISYYVNGDWYDHSVGCTVFLGSGNCTVNPPLNVSNVGVVYGGANYGGTVLVTDLSSVHVPETSSYMEFSGFGLLGLALCCYRRFSTKLNTDGERNLLA